MRFYRFAERGSATQGRAARLALTGLLFFLSAWVIQNPAAAQTWTGANSNDWTDPDNWSSKVVPTTGAVTINKTSPNVTVLGVIAGAQGTTGNFVLGSGASPGDLTIQNGADLVTTGSAFQFIGLGAGSVGTMTITGAGSSWTVNGIPGAVSVLLGRFGNGTLKVENGGTATFAGDLVVGESNGGKGTLLIASGGVVSTGRDGYIARFLGSTGTATVTGAGSHWSIASRLFIGNAGVSGALNIADGGKVTVATTTTVADVGTPGTLNITGGTLQTRTLTKGSGAAQVNLDGATLRANANNAGFITKFSGTQLNVKAGGVTVDTAGFSVGTDMTSAFTGVGGLTVTGGGTFTGSASNSYAGETWIESGTIALSGGGSVANTSRVVADGTFDISGIAGTGVSLKRLSGNGSVALGAKSLTLTAANDVFSGVIGGTGGVTIVGGTQTLSGDNTYSGITTLIPGTTLQLGDGGATGSIAGEVTNNGALILNRSGTLTLDGLISGSGSVEQKGPGTTVLTADNTYGGGTTITGGTLQLGDGKNKGSIIGNVLNNGALVFNRSDMVTFGGVISGSGAVEQLGGGTTVLTGTNSHLGATTVSNGTLLINGNQSAANGAIIVSSGATLGGTGTIGGDVTIANGGILAPGDAGNVPGTLNIAENLTLNDTSELNYDFGQANVVGGAFNDLTKVGGDLVLDGVLKISTPVGTFSPGIYRIISYDGVLTANQGLGIDNPTLGLQVQTSVLNQVNLVNSTGLTLNYWDGDAGLLHSGTLEGGNGTWHVAPTGTSWTTEDAALNAAFANGSFAIFAGQPGTVSVNNGPGQVMVAGMQFATSGYLIQGQPIELVGSSATVRVGDGSSDGTSYVATIDTQLKGTAQLVMTDLGTLVLTAGNAYTGGTRFDGGVIQISKDSNLGLAGTTLTFDGGGLQTTQTMSTDRAVDLISTGRFLPDVGTSLALTGAITGAGGSLIMDGAGELVLAGTATYDGDTLVQQGTLSAGGANTFSAASAHSVAAGATLNLNGYDQAIGALKNAGTVDFNGVPGTTLTVNGNYEGAGGLLKFNTALGDDSSATDRLVVQGDTSGSSNIAVKNAGGTGAQTTEGIKLIDVAGASNGSFALIGDYVFKGEQAVVGGAYAYMLHQGGVSTPGDGDWYLRSELVDSAPDVPPGPVFQPGAPLFEAYPQILLSLMSMPTLRERVGYDALSGRGRPAPMPAAYIGEGGSYLGGPSAARYKEDPIHRDLGRAWWGRVDASRISIEPSSTTGATYDADQVRLQTGFDALINANPAGRLLAGFTVQHGSSWAQVSSVYGDGKINTEGYGIGGTLTWLGFNGLYVDTQAQVTWFDTDIRSALAGSMEESDDAMGWGVSVETGKRFMSSGPWALTPQAQLSYTSVDFDFTDPFGAAVSADDGDSLLGRLGLALDHRTAWIGGNSHLYGIANLYYEFLDGTSADVSGTRLISQRDELWGGLGLGGTYSWGADKYALFGEVSVNSSLEHFGDSASVNGTAGFRIRW